MNMLIRSMGVYVLALLAVVLLLPTNKASAQTCGPGQTIIGMTPGGNGIAPMPICGGSGANGSEAQPASPTGYWKKTWGAMAADGEKGILGAATGKDSKGEAEVAAMAECQSKGGKCDVFSYYNQCAALISGNKSFIRQTAATVERASEIGMRTCSATDGGCRVYYSACSVPVFVQK